MLANLNKPNTTLDSVIGQWNTSHDEAVQERKESKLDFKSKLDELFRNAGKSYYRGR
jgi:hypothetical protein